MIMSEKSKARRKQREQKEEQQAKRVIFWIVIALLAFACLFLGMMFYQ